MRYLIVIMSCFLLIGCGLEMNEEEVLSYDEIKSIVEAREVKESNRTVEAEDVEKTPQKPVEKVVKTTTSTNDAEKKEEDGRLEDTESGSPDYNSPEDAPWNEPYNGYETDADAVENGQHGQVTTIWGNGIKGQDDLMMSKPRKIALDSKGNIYYIDGTDDKQKIRMFDGEKNHTVFDFSENKLGKKEYILYETGLIIINDKIYYGAKHEIYEVLDNNVLKPIPGIKKRMKDQRYEQLHHIHAYNGDIYIMYWTKSRSYIIERYDIKTGASQQITDARWYNSPYSMFVTKDKIIIGTRYGNVVIEELFPRETRLISRFHGDKTHVSDAWIGKDGNVYFITWDNQVRFELYVNPPGEDNSSVLIGGRRGYIDGFYTEVEMDYPIDFVWDGTGYIFADAGNHSIRKLWFDVAPME